MADTRSHDLACGVVIDRTGESATAVLRDWDVHVTTILDDQGEVRVRAHDPRTLKAGVTMLRGNAHQALSAQHHMPTPSSRPMRRAYHSVAMALAGAMATLTLSGAGLAAELYTLPGWLLPATVKETPVSDGPIPRYSVGDRSRQTETPVPAPVRTPPSVLVPVPRHVHPVQQPAPAPAATQSEGAHEVSASQPLHQRVAATLMPLIRIQELAELAEIVPHVSEPVEKVTETTESVTEPVIKDRPGRRRGGSK